MRFTALVLAGILPGAAAAADIKVLSSAAVAPALLKVADQYRKDTKNRLRIQYALPAQLERRIGAGEEADVLIASSGLMNDQLRRNKLEQKAFADIAAKPRWYVPLILLILAAVGFTYAYTTRVGWEHYIRQTMENNPRIQNLPAEQREQQIQTGAKIAPIFGYVGSVVGIPIYALATLDVLPPR